MKPSKKTLYELLQLTDSATTEDIHLAHTRLLARLQALRTPHNGAEIDFRIQTIKVAHSTLSSPSSRLAYDAGLAEERRTRPPAPSAPSAPHGGGAGEPAWSHSLPPEAAAILQRANRARAGLPPEPRDEPAWMGLLSRARSSAGRVLAALGALVMLSTAANWYLHRPLLQEHEAINRINTLSEKAELQEYYQQYGVRPANLADMQLLEKERRSREQAERETARQQEKAELARQRFEEETRRRAEEVSANLRRAEEEAVNRALSRP